jgi:hypothetical protein
VRHLAEVSKEKRVILVEDIFNARGMVITGIKGVEVDKVLSKR